MHLRYPAFFSIAIAALLVGCTNVPSSTAPVGASAGSSPTATAVSNGPERALQKGMTAEEVKHIMGEPAEIKPMESPTGKAEVWVYHRTVFGHVEQVQVGSQVLKDSTSGSDGNVHTMTLAEVPIYKQAVHKDLETISLLMFDGRFISQKRTVEKRLEYQ
jgi:outer membrane protein assembly factor BamE (lipoprotein component of BamABCDE complex)